MTALNRTIRWGVLGYARIARESVIPAILRSGNSEFYALASHDEAKLAESRTRFPSGHRLYPNYEELLDDPAVDAVYVPLPNSLHREWTIRAAEHGKHVLCEKPLALDAAGCREMMAACAAHRVTLMEAFMYRYTDRTRQVLDVVRRGALGEIKFIEECSRCHVLGPSTTPDLRKLQDEDRLRELLGATGIDSATDPERGYDHGVFVPMLIVDPKAEIPVATLSLRHDRPGWGCGKK